MLQGPGTKFLSMTWRQKFGTRQVRFIFIFDISKFLSKVIKTTKLELYHSYGLLLQKGEGTKF